MHGSDPTAPPQPDQPTADGQTFLVRVNDQPRAIAAGRNLRDLLADLGLCARPGLAVAVNARVVPHATWQDQPLHDGDQIIVIKASQGG